MWIVLFIGPILYPLIKNNPIQMSPHIQTVLGRQKTRYYDRTLLIKKWIYFFLFLERERDILNPPLTELTSDDPTTDYNLTTRPGHGDVTEHWATVNVSLHTQPKAIVCSDGMMAF